MVQPIFDAQVWTHVGTALGDLPNVVRLRASSLRDWRVPDAFREGTLRPVLILPGVYETWHYLRPVATALGAAGHPVHVVTGLGLNRRPIASSAELVWRLLVERDVRDVAIVAHSKGGLIGKHLLAIDDRESRVDRLVAIATPFAGSRYSRLGFTPAVRAFRPDDPLIRSLAREAAVDARITSIYPRLDPHIPDGSELAGARNIELPIAGHFRILLDPGLPQLVVDEVERERET